MLGFWPFSRRAEPRFAAAFFAIRRPTAGAQPGLPLGARPCSAMLFVVLESTGIKAASVINKWLSLRALSLSLINKLLN